MSKNQEFGNQNVLQEERKRWSFLGLPLTFTKYILTNKKLVVTSGLFVSHENEILLYRILDMSYTRSLLQKMFGLGSLTISSQDVSSPTLVIKNIKNSRNFKELLSEQIESERIRLGIRKGEVIGGGSSVYHAHEMAHDEFHDDFTPDDCDDSSDFDDNY